MIADFALTRLASSTIFLNREVQSHSHGGCIIGNMDTWTRCRSRNPYRALLKGDGWIHEVKFDAASGAAFRNVLHRVSHELVADIDLLVAQSELPSWFTTRPIALVAAICRLACIHLSSFDTPSLVLSKFSTQPTRKVMTAPIAATT